LVEILPSHNHRHELLVDRPDTSARESNERVNLSLLNGTVSEQVGGETMTSEEASDSLGIVDNLAIISLKERIHVEVVLLLEFLVGLLLFSD